MVRHPTGGSQTNPRYKPPAQTHRKMSPIFARILKISKRLGLPTMYKRDLSIDRNAINRRHPSAVLWGVRETGTDIVCLSRGRRRKSPTGGRLLGPGEVSYYSIARSHIEYPNGDRWYYVTPSGSRSVTKAEAIDILLKYAGKWSGF